MKKNLIIVLLLVCFFSCCSYYKEIKEKNYHSTAFLPGGIKINDSLFFDVAEMSNINWREYMSWNKYVFGSDSWEFNSTIPDTLVWRTEVSYTEPYQEYYFFNKKYNDYPVVGISQQQAMDYSKWRSDRVFEFYLIGLKKIKRTDKMTKDNYFTIEKYFNGALDSFIVGRKVDYYPEIKLPNREERKIILNYSDYVFNFYLKNCYSKNCEKCKQDYFYIVSDVDTTYQKNRIEVVPTVSVLSTCFINKKKILYNLRGNVSEWASEENLSFGGGWKNTKKEIMEKDTFTYIEENAWTGFRNICIWKKWEK